MKNSVIACGLLLGFVGYGMAQGPSTSHAEHILDLTLPGTVKTAPQSNMGGRHGLAGAIQRDPPFRVSLVSLNRGEYVFGDRFVYEVDIANTGSSPVDFPWSADRAALEFNGKVYRQATVVLVLKDADGNEHLLGAEILDGSPRVAGTLETLEPGDIARIKTGGLIEVNPDVAPRVAAAGLVDVRAMLTWNDGKPEDWKPMISDDSIPIMFRLPR